MRPWLRKTLWSVALLAVAVVAIRLMADPIATRFTRARLHALSGYDGELNAVHVDFLSASYTITDLNIFEAPDKGHPLVYAKRLNAKLRVGDLLRGGIGLTVRVEDGKVTLVNHVDRTVAQAKEVGREIVHTAKTNPAGLDVVADQLQAILPARIARLEVIDGQFIFRDPWAVDKVGNAERVWIDKIEATVENVATRGKLTEGRAASIAMRGRLQKSGEILFYLSADPLAQKLNFAGRMEVSHLRLANMYSLFASHAGLSIPDGTLDLYVEFLVKNDRLSGTVKPQLHDVNIQPADASLGDIIKARLARLGEAAVRDSGKTAGAKDATSVEIGGTIAGPQVDASQAIMGILHNAFSSGLSSGFANLPGKADQQTSGEGRPLAISWDGLLVDGGAKRIRDALADNGFAAKGTSLDASTRTALSRFQASKSLPATGLPDEMTVKKLGLRGSDVFRTGSTHDTHSAPHAAN